MKIIKHPVVRYKKPSAVQRAALFGAVTEVIVCYRAAEPDISTARNPKATFTTYFFTTAKILDVTVDTVETSEAIFAWCDIERIVLKSTGWLLYQGEPEPD